MTADMNLFVVDLEYLVPLETVQTYLDDHSRFLETNYAAGHFIASGPKVPRTGGVILAKGRSKAEVEALVHQDPFHQHKVASVTVTEFVPRMTAPNLQLGPT
jgi:uncharacterized protein YciI